MSFLHSFIMTLMILAYSIHVSLPETMAHSPFCFSRITSPPSLLINEIQMGKKWQNAFLLQLQLLYLQ